MDDTFELSVLDVGDSTRLVTVARNRSDLAIESLPNNLLADLIRFRTELGQAALGNSIVPSEDALNKFGERLFEFVVRGKVLKIYQRLPGSSHIRLHILGSGADVQALPWEYMREPGTIPGPNSLRSVVRVVPTIGVEPPVPLAAIAKIRLLYVFADPIDQEEVDWEEIKSRIEREFAARSPELLEMDVIEGASPQMLFDALAKKSYDVLHFAGHGQVDATGEGELLFVNLKTHKSEPLSAQQLGMLLRGHNLRLVVLSSCDSSAGDFAKPFAVVAKTLVEASVASVVANQFPLTNSTAAKFAKAFYGELIKTGDVDRATTQGRVFLALEPPRANAARFEWGIPTLYRHVAAAKLWNV